MLKRYRKLLLACAAIAAFMVSPVSTLMANAAPAPCSPGSDGKYNCTFWTTTPLEGPSNGTLAQGTNWVTCQQAGKTVTVSGWENNWWAWTLRDSGTGTYGSGWGWVNAVYAKGGNNYEGFGSAPNCNGGHGLPPQAPQAAPSPQAAPAVQSTPPARAPAAAGKSTPAAKTSQQTTSTSSSSTDAASASTTNIEPTVYTTSCPPTRTCYYPTGEEFSTNVQKEFKCGMDRVYYMVSPSGQLLGGVCRGNLQMATRLLQNDRY